MVDLFSGFGWERQHVISFVELGDVSGVVYDSDIIVSDNGLVANSIYFDVEVDVLFEGFVVTNQLDGYF